MTSRRFPPPWTIKKLAECFIVRDKLAQHIIETKSVAFDPAMLEDHYRNALVRILRKKQAKMPAPPAPVAPSRENVINLMDALRRSIAAEPPVKKPAAASKAARAKRRSPVRHR
jgi:DNA end-binding protein Ku